MRARRGGREGDALEGAGHGADPSSLAMSDLFSALFLLLIAMLVVALMQLVAAKGELEEAAREHEALARHIGSRVEVYRVVIEKLTRIKELLARERIPVAVDPKSGEVIIKDEGVMFSVREARLSEGARGFLGRFASVYFKVVLDDSFIEHIRWVVVEGHASVEGEELPNLELSASRANAVAAFLLEELERRAFGGEGGARLTDEQRAARLDGCQTADCERLRRLKERLIVAGRGEFGARREVVDARDRSVRFRLHFKADLFDLYEDERTRRLILEPQR